MDLFVRAAGPADAEDIALVQRLSWQSTYAGLLRPESLTRAQETWGVDHWLQHLERTDDQLVPLVLDGPSTGIVGFGVAGPRRGGADPLIRKFEGEIYLLYLLQAVQGRGYGLKLMTALARVMRARGMESALVWALATNRSAIGFYQRLAGSFLVQRRRPLFGESVTEIALGWRDLEVLTDTSRHLRD
jgi:ribosomal protein S18 acetylase RimI-like enzyme